MLKLNKQRTLCITTNFSCAISMDKAQLVAECSRLLAELSNVTTRNIDLEAKLADKIIRQRNLSQQVSDSKKANSKLSSIINSLRDEQYITAEAAEILKVN